MQRKGFLPWSAVCAEVGGFDSVVALHVAGGVGGAEVAAGEGWAALGGGVDVVDGWPLGVGAGEGVVDGLSADPAVGFGGEDEGAEAGPGPASG